MWTYEKKMLYPVKVNSTNPGLAKLLITQYGGPNGELSAALTYLTQRYTMPTNNTKALLTDIGTEELAHLEMIAALCYKLTKCADREQLMEGGYFPYFANFDKAIFMVDPSGNPWTAAYSMATGDAIADLTNNMAAEQKARATYNHLMDMTDDPGVLDTLRFLREREVVHFQRFGEGLVQVQQDFACKKVF